MITRSIPVRGVTLHARISEPLQSVGGTLVLLHGFTGSALSWGEHQEVFAASGLRVIALDLLGHGESDAPEEAERYSIQHCCQDILGALQELGVQAGSAVLLGYSLGGRIALYTAFSGFFQGLVLESASPGIADPGEREQRRQSDNALATRIEQDGILPFVDYWESLPLFASQQALPLQLLATLHAERLHNQASGLANSLRGVGTGVQPALHDALAQLDIPCLLVAGALDVKYRRIAAQMARRLPFATLCIVPEAGHTVHLERPEVFDAAVLGFCRETGASSRQCGAEVGAAEGAEKVRQDSSTEHEGACTACGE